jgi:hypothetical protein
MLFKILIGVAWINIEQPVNKNGLIKMIKAKLLWQETLDFIINYLWRKNTL